MAQQSKAVKAVAAAIKSEKLEWAATDNELTALPAKDQKKRLGLVVSEQEMQTLIEATQLKAAEETQAKAISFGAPASVDWRNIGGKNFVTPVKNQGSCGSCVSFCTCATMESAVRIKLGNPNHNIDLSEAFCQFCGGGSCGGWGLTSGLAFAKSTGVTDEACMPYQPTNMNCSASRCSNWQSRLTKIISYSAHATMAARKNAIATKGPVLAGMRVYNDFFSYSSGVYQKTAGASVAGYHCICVVGYNDSQQCWILKNSWGTNWGENGFCRIKYGQADLLLDSSWSYYSVDVKIKASWISGLIVNLVYASRHSQNGWVHFKNLGWRRIKAGSADGVTNMLNLFVQAKANGKAVAAYCDANNVFQAFML